MRRFLFALLLGCAVAFAGGASAAESEGDPLATVPPPLRHAVEKVAENANRWAYTQHVEMLDGKGKVQENYLVRFDPSRHPDEQWTLLQQEGKPATPAQIKKDRKERKKHAKERKTFGELLDLPQARAVVDPAAAGLLTYEAPLRADDGFTRRFAGKLRVRVRVDPATETLARIDVTLLEPVRAVLVAKIKDVTVALNFHTVAPQFPPPLTDIRLEAGGTVALLPVTQRTEVTRTEFKRVTPFDERFSVKLAPLQTIDF